MALSHRLSLSLLFLFLWCFQGRSISAPSPAPLPDVSSPSPSPSDIPKSKESVPPPSLAPFSPSVSLSPPPVDERADPSRSPQHVRWCTTSLAELNFCTDILPSLSVKGEQVWSCVVRSSPLACMYAIGQGEAELISVESGLAYYAFTKLSMKAIMMERVDRGLELDAVAVVTKELCDGTDFLTFDTLKGKRSCHGNYWSGAGWNIPLETLINLKNIDPDSYVPREDESPDITLMSEYFSMSCAPGDKDTMRLCTGCLTEQGEGNCDTTDSYSGSSGSFRCLVEDAGDVAFTRSQIVSRYSLGGILQQKWAQEPVSEYMFLCPGGGCQPVTDNPSYFNCTLGKIPTNVIMTRNSISERDKLAIIGRLQQAGSVAKWTKALYFGKNTHEYLLSSSAVGLVPADRLTREILSFSGKAAESVQELNAQLSATLSDETSHAGRGRLLWRCTFRLIPFLSLAGVLWF